MIDNERAMQWAAFARVAAVNGVLTVDMSEYVDLSAACGVVVFGPPNCWVQFMGYRVEVVERWSR